MKKIIFISDMHFSENTIDFNHLIKTKLSQWKGKIDALYMLGDIFDVWIGDDDDATYIKKLAQAFKDFAIKTPLYIMQGNRDFLLGKKFANDINATLLNDPCIVSLYGEKYILTHGDLMCTLDVEYQKFRQQAHNKIWQQNVLNQPLLHRRILAKQIRNLSETKKTNDDDNIIFDVTQKGMDLIQEQFKNIHPTPKTLIHGHTHKPNIHKEFYLGKAFTRVVIPDWRSKQQGCVIIDSKNNIKIQYF